MHRIDDASNVAVLPTPAAAGTAGYFTKGDPVGGIEATIVTDDWCNAVQEELIAIVNGAALSPSKTTRDQVLSGVRRYASNNLLVLTATTTLTAAHIGRIFVSAAAGNVTLTLPAANVMNGACVPLTIFRTDTSANGVTIQRAGTDLLMPGSVTSYVMTVGENLELISDGISSWFSPGSNMLGRRLLQVSGSGNFVAPAFCQSVEIEAWSAGGTGASGNGSTQAGGGGGAGGYAKCRSSLVPGTTYAYVVGVAGTPPASSTTNGVTGGLTSFGALLTITGGIGGLAAGAGGAGGTVSGVTAGFGLVGNAGSAGTAAIGGQGGASFGSVGGAFNTQFGGPGQGPGAAGAGAFLASAGNGLANNGVMILRY